MSTDPQAAQAAGTPSSEAARNLKGFTFTCLAKFAEEGTSAASEIWRCKKPGTGVFSFDICVTSRGISVMGDIESLVFNVRSDYGIAFLAGSDVEGYIHSKLEPQFKHVELDEERLVGACMEMTDSALEEAGVEERCPAGTKGAARLIWQRDALVEAKKALLPGTTDWRRIGDAASFVSDAINFMRADGTDAERLAKAHELFQEHAGKGVSAEWYEWRLTKPDFSVLMRLHMVNLAARAILEQQKPQPVDVNDDNETSDADGSRSVMRG